MKQMFKPMVLALAIIIALQIASPATVGAQTRIYNIGGADRYTAPRVHCPDKIRIGFGFLKNPSEQLINELNRAWAFSGSGMAQTESVVLVFLRAGRRYEARLLEQTNERKQASFKWNPAAVAIIHTHPNFVDSAPAPADEEISVKFGVPIFTITTGGMFAYDPLTRRTVKVMNNLKWLKYSNWTDGAYERTVAQLLELAEG